MLTGRRVNCEGCSPSATAAAKDPSVAPSAKAYGDMHAPKSPSAVPPFQDKAAAIQPGAMRIRIGKHASSGSRDQIRNRDYLSPSPCRSSKAVWTQDGGNTAFTQTLPAFEGASSIENEQDRTPSDLGGEDRTHTAVDGLKGPDERRTPTLPPVQPSHPLLLQTVDPSTNVVGEQTPVPAQMGKGFETCPHPSLASGPTRPLPGVRTIGQPTCVQEPVLSAQSKRW